jgi:hypothetical protein
LFKRELRSPRRSGKRLKEELKEVEPHSRGNRILSRGGSDRISKEITLMPTHFLVPGVEEEAEEELSHVSHVEKTVTKPWIVQRERWTEEPLTSSRRRGVMSKMRTLEVGSH